MFCNTANNAVIYGRHVICDGCNRRLFTHTISPHSIFSCHIKPLRSQHAWLVFGTLVAFIPILALLAEYGLSQVFFVARNVFRNEDSTRDKAEGRFHEMKGKVKEFTGKAQVKVGEVKQVFND